MEIGCNYRITLIGCDEKTKFLSNLTIILCCGGIQFSQIGVLIEQIDSLGDIVNGIKF